MAKRIDAEIRAQLERVGRNFLWLLAEKRLDIRDVAQKSGLTVKTLSSILKGSDCEVSTLLCLAYSLGVDVDVFFVKRSDEPALEPLPDKRKRQFRLKNCIEDMISKGDMASPMRCIDVVKYLKENYNIGTNTKIVSVILGRLIAKGVLNYDYDENGHKLYFAA